MSVRKRTLVTAAVFVFGLLLAAAGARAGENAVIRDKGAVICLECIGIG
ncbi:MAG: hypothetical protein FWE91_05400 [Defluviitaleaceae bacterium]|nr:hypothetical protein [Defluviitaleaceae bacterium]MCL2836120.1 hypothetical protein [Defluviitaleaceae bacterium]